MKTKLTLSIDAMVIEKAKLVSGKKKQSLSFIVEDFLKSTYKNWPKKQKATSTFTEEFRKKFPAPKSPKTGKQIEKMRHDHLMKKYGY